MLSGRMIKHHVQEGNIVIDPLIEKHIGPNSVDLTLADELRIYPFNDKSHELDMKIEPKTRTTRIPPEGYKLLPGRLYLGMTQEIFGAKDMFVPCLSGRSSVGRLGISIHVTAGFGDVGFVNHWTLEIFVVEPVRIYAGVRIAQAYFYPLIDFDDGERVKYDGKYKEVSTSPGASRLYLDFKS